MERQLRRGAFCSDFPGSSTIVIPAGTYPRRRPRSHPRGRRDRRRRRRLVDDPDHPAGKPAPDLRCRSGRRRGDPRPDDPGSRPRPGPIGRRDPQRRLPPRGARLVRRQQRAPVRSVAGPRRHADQELHVQSQLRRDDGRRRGAMRRDGGARQRHQLDLRRQLGAQRRSDLRLLDGKPPRVSIPRRWPETSTTSRDIAPTSSGIFLADGRTVPDMASWQFGDSVSQLDQ